MEKKNGMRVEIGKLMKSEWLKTAGKKGSAVPANGVMVASNVNLAILAMVGKPAFNISVKPIVTLINWPEGSNNYFPVVKFVAPAGTMFAGVVKSNTEKMLEFEHYKVWNSKERKYDEVRPSAIREQEIVPGALTALNDRLFPKSDLTDRPIPETDWSAKLCRDFHVAPEKMVETAKMVRETPGMTWQAMYIAYANAKKA